MTQTSFLQKLLGLFRSPVTPANSGPQQSPTMTREGASVTTPPRDKTSSVDRTIAAIRAGVSKDLTLPEKEWITQSGPFPSVQHFFDLSFESFKDLLLHTDITPASRVLDYGCGLARLAIPLSGYLDQNEGSYHGVDTDAQCVRRNQAVFSDYPNISFQHVDLYSKMYNPEGKPFATLATTDFGGPFDLAFLFSVFTHILPEDCDQLLDVLRKQLAPGGEIFSSWFLLNDETHKAIDQGLAHRQFAHPHGVARVDHPNVPEGAVAYYESDVLERFHRAGLKNVQVHFGKWRGDRESRLWQDVIVANVRA